MEQRKKWVSQVHCFIMLPCGFCEGELIKNRVTAAKQRSSQTEREPKSDRFSYEATVHAYVVSSFKVRILFMSVFVSYFNFPSSHKSSHASATCLSLWNQTVTCMTSLAVFVSDLSLVVLLSNPADPRHLCSSPNNSREMLTVFANLSQIPAILVDLRHAYVM